MIQILLIYYSTPDISCISLRLSCFENPTLSSLYNSTLNVCGCLIRLSNISQTACMYSIILHEWFILSLISTVHTFVTSWISKKAIICTDGSDATLHITVMSIWVSLWSDCSLLMLCRFANPASLNGASSWVFINSPVGVASIGHPYRCC